MRSRSRSRAGERAVEHPLEADPQEDAYHLHLKREAEGVEFSDRPPRQDLVATIEAYQVLDLLRRREMSPAGRQIGNARHVRESDDAAVVETDALLAHSLERRACHLRTRVVDVGCRGKRPVSRACEESGFPRSSAEHRHRARCSGFPVLLQAISFED